MFKSVFMMVVVVTLVAYAVFNIVNNPPNNLLEGVLCTVESYHPADFPKIKVGQFTGETKRDASAVIRLEEGTITTATMIEGPCHAGEEAYATIRVGRITGKLIKVVFVVCHGR